MGCIDGTNEISSCETVHAEKSIIEAVVQHIIII
jgi:hypothetical protein